MYARWTSFATNLYLYEGMVAVLVVLATVVLPEVVLPEVVLPKVVLPKVVLVSVVLPTGVLATVVLVRGANMMFERCICFMSVFYLFFY